MHPPILLLGPLAKRNRQEESVHNCSGSPFNNYESEIRAHAMVDERYLVDVPHPRAANGTFCAAICKAIVYVRFCSTLLQCILCS